MNHASGQPICETPLVDIKNVSFSYGNNLVLRDVNATIQDRPNHGQIVGLLSPSGGGKTTLIRILAGFLCPSTGSIMVYDDNGQKPIPVQRGSVGVVTQDYYVFPHYTVMKNLLLAAAKKNGTTKAQQREKVMEYLERFSIAEHKNKFPRQLSGGQKQRVAIIQQLLCSERYNLMDEPFSGLDPNMKESVARLINEVSDMNEHNTIILSTHDITQALATCDMLWLIGRDRTPDGKPLPGAYIKKTYDLAAEGLAWHPDVTLMPKFSEMLREVRAAFREL